MSKHPASALLLALFCALLSSCIYFENVKGACASFCERTGECIGAAPSEILDCRQMCQDELAPRERACHHSFFELTDCFEENSCDTLNSGAACQEETNDFATACQFDTDIPRDADADRALPWSTLTP